MRAHWAGAMPKRKQNETNQNEMETVNKRQKSWCFMCLKLVTQKTRYNRVWLGSNPGRAKEASTRFIVNEIACLENCIFCLIVACLAFPPISNCGWEREQSILHVSGLLPLLPISLCSNGKNEIFNLFETEQKGGWFLLTLANFGHKFLFGFRLFELYFPHFYHFVFTL